MLIYRIEHRDTGWGPYQIDNPANKTNPLVQALGEKLDTAHHESHPIFKAPGYRSGFLRKCHAREWFKGFWEKLGEADYVMRVYAVVKTKRCPTSTQLLFEHSTAIRLRTIEIRV